MLVNITKLLGGTVILTLAALLYLAKPEPLPQSAIVAHKPDIKNGEVMYNAGGCISCHKSKTGDLPSGGSPLKTPIGVFYPPNITPDKTTGIGSWSNLDFINAMQRGLSPDGKHYFPAFPYTSYSHMQITDLLDLKAYLMSLKPVVSKSKPFNKNWLRPALGLWKRMALTTNAPDMQSRGAYLVNGPGHCNECHTRRNIFMITDTGKPLTGAPHIDGKGKVPSLRNLKAARRFTDPKDLNNALRFGEVLGYDNFSSGGMGDVQTNMAKLPNRETMAIAQYLMSLK